MLSLEPNHFDFPPAPEGIRIFLYVLNACYFLLYVIFSGLLYLRRTSRFLRPRFPPTLFLFFTYETYCIVISSASIIGGKAPTCIPLEVLYTSATFFTFHFIVSPAVLLIMAKVNEEKRVFLQGQTTSVLWRILPYINSLFWRLGCAFLFGALQAGIYLIVHFVSPLPGDCNRTAILILSCSHLILAVGGSIANFWLVKVRDPIYWKIEISLAGVLNFPNVVIIAMYAFNPVIFPAWFDFRWLNIFNGLVTLVAVVAFPVSLTFPKCEQFMKKLFRLQDSLDPDDMDTKTNNFLFSLTTKVDELQAVLDHPVLREAFLSYCGRLWCCENVLFILEVQEFRSNYQESETSHKAARRIAEQYFTRDGALEINLLASTRTIILENIESNITAETFVPAEREIGNLVKTDSLKKWYLTTDFRDVLLRITTTRNSSSGMASFEMSSSAHP